MRKNLFTLFVLSALLLIPNTGKATDYAPIGDLPVSPSQSSTVPLYTGSGTFTSIVQQLYYASELTAAGASAGDINALKFYFGNNSTTVREVTRNLEIYIKLVPASFTEFEVGFTNTDKYTYKFTDPGSASTNKVFDGNYTIPATVNNGDKIERTINTSRFYWDGTSNIVVTVIDKTNKKFYSVAGDDYSDSNLKSYGKTLAVSASRFVHQKWTEANSENFTTYKNSLNGKFGYCSKNSTTESTERDAHSYVNYIKFSIVPPIPVPTSPSAGSITTNSAVLSWTAAADADSYEVRYGTTSGSLGAATNVGNVTSYSLSELEEETTYYYQIRTKIGSEYSAWTSESSFTTLTEAAHEHNGISFNKWSSTTSMPTSGNYYLANDVTYDFDEGGYLNLAGDLNLCLNGHTINLGTKSINVTNGKTMTLYDPVGGGKITGFVPGHAGTVDYMGVISVENNGTLVLREGEVENTYPDDNPEYKSIAIAVGGTLILSGAPVISSNEMDIYLPPTIPAKVITIEPGKPLTNTTPYRVYKSSGVLTSGWANMSGADPKDYFVSANPGKSVCLDGGEASLRSLLTLSESSENSSIGDNYNQTVDVNLTRSTLVSSQYNTFCLPFALDNAQLEDIFGASYDLEEFVGSELEDDVLSLTFNKVTDLEAGKPYLLQPSIDVTNPSFEGVTITATSPVDQTSDTYISFHGTFAPTELTGGDKNTLFLGSGNELFYPSTTANIKAFRAYFEVKGDARKAAKRARIVKKEDAATGIQNTEHRTQTQKVLRNGQLYIIRDGKTYNVLGIECK